MTTEYIEKQDIYDAIDLLMTRFPYKVPGRPDTYHPYNKALADACSHALDLIKHHPPADVRPVVRGRWEWKHRHRGGFRRVTGEDDFGVRHTITVDERFEIDDPYCPYCGKLNESVFLNFCPNCGADMRGGDVDG